MSDRFKYSSRVYRCMMSRLMKAKEMTDSVMQVENGIYAIPSQSRGAKAHIVRSVPINIDISVPNSFAVEAEELTAIANSGRRQNEFIARAASLLEALAEKKESCERYECSCEDFKYRGGPCKHILSVAMSRSMGKVE